MINIKINNLSISMEENSTILDVAKKYNIEISTLCFLKGINENASCRMCVVEIKGIENLVPSCITKIYEGMEIYTNSNKVINARKQNLELILSNHNKDCDNCIRNNNCKLQDLIKEYNIDETKFQSLNKKFNIDKSSSYLVRDNSKCILCGRCVAVCKEIQGIEVIGKNKRGIKTEIGCAFEKKINNVPCIGCGQCILVCPTGALVEKDDIDIVEQVINEKTKHIIAVTAPSIRVALGEEFGYEIGTNVKGKMVAAIRQLGFDKVFDVNFGADLTIMEEKEELKKRIIENKNLPMFTSCCPAWIKYIEYNYPDKLNHLSTCKSPQQMIGTIIKSYYAEKNNINPKDIFAVSIMPCTAKKFENKREEQQDDIDAVLTTRELARFIKKKNIDFNNLKEEEFDSPLGTGGCVIFGSSGGVMTSAIRTLVEEESDNKINEIDFKSISPGIKEATINILGKELNIAIINGIKYAKKILDNDELKYHFIEVMACPEGCINGGGQPIIDFSKYNWKEVKELRTKSLIDEENNLTIKKAHQNKDIKELYDTYLDAPGSIKAHELLHTKYQKRNKYEK